jgi:hypothetical protein
MLAASRFLKLPPKLRRYHAMLGNFSRAKKNHRHIMVVPRAQHRIVIDIHFAQPRPKLGQQRRHHCLRLFAKMASRPRVERDVERTRGGKPTILFTNGLTGGH